MEVKMTNQDFLETADFIENNIKGTWKHNVFLLLLITLCYFIITVCKIIYHISIGMWWIIIHVFKPVMWFLMAGAFANAISQIGNKNRA